MISSTARLADRVSGRVRRLDDAKKRVGETKKRVEDLLVLKSCSYDVNSALKRDDYEQAAMHIHRCDYLKMAGKVKDGGKNNGGKNYRWRRQKLKMARKN